MHGVGIMWIDKKNHKWPQKKGKYKSCGPGSSQNVTFGQLPWREGNMSHIFHARVFDILVFIISKISQTKMHINYIEYIQVTPNQTMKTVIMQLKYHVTSKFQTLRVFKQSMLTIIRSS